MITNEYRKGEIKKISCCGKMKFELDFIQELANVLKNSELTEITLEDGDKAIILKKEVVTASYAAPQVIATAPASASSSAPEAFVCTPAEVKKGKAVTSPMVGTFYKAASPGAKPFAEVGTTVSEGQVVCIIEAMKLMNEIESEFAGKVVEICVEDGQAVEFGQVLMYVE